MSPPPASSAPPERRDVTALLVIDMFSPMDGGDGRALRRTAPKVLPVIGELIQRARAAGVPVVYVENHEGRWTATADELVDAARKHGLGDDLTPILPAPGDPFVIRARPSAFDRSQLEDLLQSRGVRRVILTGQATEQGILYSALDASVSRFKVVVPQDAVAAIDSSLAGAALRMMDRNMHADVTQAGAIDFSVTKVQPPIERVRTPRPVRVPLSSADGSPVPPVSETRQQLLSALAIVISREGFGGAKVADIAREARTSLRTFYAEFSSKEECFLELHRQITVAVVDSVSASVVFDRPWVEVMRKGFETYFNILMAQPLLTHAILVELATLSPEARAAREEAMDMFAAMLCDLVEQGRAANPELESRALSPMIARGIMGAFMELVVSHVDRGETDRFPELIDTTTDMLTSVVLVNVAADPAAAAAEANAALQTRA
ncbi:MAG: isochorismatase family protein [Solirubrobacteraceae bacterium]|nr:isochorismatase family protein [Solirubrobacteraceae bacterium]